MRHLLTTVALSLALGAGAALPAAAGSGDHGRHLTPHAWTDGPGLSPARRTVHPQHLRLARATISDAYDEETARPRRHARSHYGKRRHHGRSARKVRRHQRAAHRRHVGRRIAAHHRARTAHHRRAAPAWTRRSLSTAGRRHSGSLGIASYYSQPQRVASGGWFNPNAMTAAHRTLPFGSRVRVTHMGSGRSVEVVINDRGPFIAGRIIDLSRAAARILGMGGFARVRLDVLGR